MAFGKKDDAEVVTLREQLSQAHVHIGQLQGWVNQIRGAETGQLEADLRSLRETVERTAAEEAGVRSALTQAQAELTQVQDDLVETRELAILQEVGIYEYAHPLEDALAYKDALADLRRSIKEAAKADAVTCQVDWAVNGSIREGQKVGRDIAKLMLRAYNTEADNAVRTVKPHTRESVKTRLSKSRDTIAKLGAALHITISAEYHRLRVQEVDLTADYLMKVEVEKEIERAERERLREEAKVMKEIERERARLAKERAHYQAAAARLAAGGGDDASRAALEAKLAELDAAVESVEARAANVRCGYVYVISNVGAFGPDMVKIGLTRRLDPMDRVRELGDASVPFRFDVHALFFSDDAVALENELHRRFAPKRVNLVNMRREFFYATPAEVRDALVDIGNDHVLEYNADVEAVEWRASNPHRRDRTEFDGDLPAPAAAALAATGSPTGSLDVDSAVDSGVGSGVGAGVGSGVDLDGDLSDDGDA